MAGIQQDYHSCGLFWSQRGGEKLARSEEQEGVGKIACPEDPHTDQEAAKGPWEAP